MNKPTRLFDYIDHQVATQPDHKAISSKENGTWKSYSFQEFQNQVNTYSSALLASGIQKGDTIALIANNRPEWNFCDNGILQIGAVNVPIYPTSSLNDYKFILNNAEVKFIFISDEIIYDKIKQIKTEIPSLKEVYSFDQIEGCKHISSFLAMADKSNYDEIERIKSTIDTHDLATIIYTSGTTGNPKGVMLSHRNIIFNIECVADIIPIRKGEPVLSFLPLCHIFERVATYVYFSVGVSLYYAESIDTLKDNISEVKPVFFTCVPRLLEKIHAGMIAKGQELSGIKKMIYYWAVRLAHKPNAKKKLVFGFYDKMVFSKWRAALGDNINGIVTGAAALQPQLNIFFNNIGVPTREAYGMTEAAPGIAINMFGEGQNNPGTVGLILNNVEIKFDHREGMGEGEGEILIKGENVMLGYYKNEEATAATIKDGWLITGDVGKMVDGKFLKITDRVKELFKTSGGKYVAPQHLENKLKESKYIEQIIVIGNNRKFVSAIIVPTIGNFKLWAGYKKLNLDFNSTSWTQDKMILAKMQKEIDRFNVHFNQVEQIKKYTLLNAEWSIDKGELTPTMKLKRKVIEANNVDVIEAMYKD
jgi:long-chain acyl-CoA synthetase